MLGFHSDGIRLFGASDTLKANLKKRKLPLVGSTTGNTLVFAIDDETVIHKRPYNISFAAVSTPWFVCGLTGVPDYPQVLPFASEHDLAAFITAMYYASQEFLHLDIELSFIKETLGADPTKVIRSYEESDFDKIPKGTPVICFYFGNGGFLETDRIFHVLTGDNGLDMGQVTLAGSFASKQNLLVAFALAEKSE